MPAKSFLARLTLRQTKKASSLLQRDPETPSGSRERQPCWGLESHRRSRSSASGMAAWLASCAVSLDAHAGAPSPPEGATGAQLARGEDIYFASCAMCHNDDLSGGAAHSAPALTGEGFLGRWSGRSALDLLEVVRTTMPEGQPGSLDERGYLDVIAFVLMRNGIALGDAALTQQSIKQISMR